MQSCTEAVKRARSPQGGGKRFCSLGIPFSADVFFGDKQQQTVRAHVHLNLKVSLPGGEGPATNLWYGGDGAHPYHSNG